MTPDDAAGLAGRRFWKMSGSGNDFVFIDGRTERAAAFRNTTAIQRICARGTGVGADGLVVLSAPTQATASVALGYFNADGSIATLCGNATLCTASLAVRLGAADPSGFAIETGSGVLDARVRDGLPEFDLPAVARPSDAYKPIPREPGEQRLGFATVGIPHVVIEVVDVSNVDVIARGRQVRHDASLREGANVNFVSRDAAGRWRIRTYERGVEAETLACGTGSVATAILLSVWGEASGDVELQTASGRMLGIRSSQGADGVWRASLRGEGRLVFEGELQEI